VVEANRVSLCVYPVLPAKHRSLTLTGGCVLLLPPWLLVSKHLNKTNPLFQGWGAPTGQGSQAGPEVQVAVVHGAGTSPSKVCY